MLDVDGQRARRRSPHHGVRRRHARVRRRAAPPRRPRPGPDGAGRPRRRDVEPGLVREQLHGLQHGRASPWTCTLGLRVAGRPRPDGRRQGRRRPCRRRPRPASAGGELTWQAAGLRAHRAAAPGGAHDATRATTCAPLGRRRRARAVGHPRAAARPSTTRAAVVTGPDRRRVLEPTRGDQRRPAAGPGRSSAGLDDLRLLRLADPADDAEEEFLGAGAPWFLTLFGRDSLWTARMLLPVTTDLAMSTLRLLAHRQGTRTDDATAEEPGKILHEVRGPPASASARTTAPTVTCPPVYYGTIDATPLWALTLHDAWRWGLPDRRGRAAAARARAGAGLAGRARRRRRRPPAGVRRPVRATGLSNQGWKDSGDAVRRSDGSRAQRAARAVRGAGLRVRGRDPRGRPARGVRIGRAPTAGGSGPSGCGGEFARAVLGRGRPSGRSRRSRSTATSARSSR